MRILLSGLGGHMGAEVAKLCAEGFRGAELAAGVDYLNWKDAAVPCAPDFDSACADVDCVVDFSHHSCTGALLAFAVKHRLPVVIATTGRTGGRTRRHRGRGEGDPGLFRGELLRRRRTADRTGEKSRRRHAGGGDRDH